MHATFQSEYLMGTDDLGDLNVHGRTILKCILKKKDMA
jgi:hypothetical protein